MSVVVMMVVAAALYGAGAAPAAPPANDAFESPVAVGGLPFEDTVGIVEATTEPNEPLAWWGQSRTVWWSFTPAADAILRLSVGGDVWAFVSVYRADAPGIGGLTRIASGRFGPSATTFPVEEGTTYYLQGGDDQPYGWTSTVGIGLAVVAPPANDDFADATAFTSVPFHDAVDLTAASVEPGEPAACGTSPTQSAWYAFTPTASGSYGAFGVTGVNVYTGGSLTGLSSVACSEWPGLYFHAEAGTTYYLQSLGGSVSVDVVPPPEVGWIASPPDPSVFDETVLSYWIGGYYDPTVTGWDWRFGDGTTGSGSSVAHRYLRDGDYPVTLTVSARGGRTNSTTQTLQVRTHDVSVLALVTPDKARAGKQGVISVGIGNTRYPESVRVDLYKVTSQGDVLVGVGIQAVKVLKPKKTVLFTFNYTFTGDDAVIGKLPFKAVATIDGVRDAANGDNVAISTPTLVFP